MSDAETPEDEQGGDDMHRLTVHRHAYCGPDYATQIRPIRRVTQGEMDRLCVHLQAEHATRSESVRFGLKRLSRFVPTKQAFKLKGRETGAGCQRQWLSARCVPGSSDQRDGQHAPRALGRPSF